MEILFNHNQIRDLADRLNLPLLGCYHSHKRVLPPEKKP
jgi:hypothetical protein